MLVQSVRLQTCATVELAVKGSMWGLDRPRRSLLMGTIRAGPKMVHWTIFGPLFDLIVHPIKVLVFDSVLGDVSF